MSESKQQVTTSTDVNDLYDNPMVRAAMKALSPEEQAQYKRVGRYMYDLNYEADDPKDAIKRNIVDPRTPEQVLIQAEESLKSGLNPMELCDMEVYILSLVYGRTWYNDFDYEKSDVPPIPEKQKLVMDKNEEMRLRRYKKSIIERQTGKKYTKKKITTKHK